MRRNRIMIPMNEIYKKDKNEEGTKVIKEDGGEVTLLDKLSNTYPRPILTIIGRINCVENGLLYLTSSNMRISDMKNPYEVIKKHLKTYMRRTHNVEHYGILELIITADSLLSDRELVKEILEYEDFKDFENVDLLSTVKVKAGFVKDVEPYYKRKSYTKALKKVIWEIKNSFHSLEEAFKEKELINEDDELAPKTILNLDKEQYKAFKNVTKAVLCDIIVDRIGKDANIMEGVRGAEILLAKDLEEAWIK